MISSSSICSSIDNYYLLLTLNIWTGDFGDSSFKILLIIEFPRDPKPELISTVNENP